MLHKILLALIFGMTVSCMKINKKGEEVETNKNEVQAHEQRNVITYEYLFHENAESVQFFLPENIGSDLVVEKYRNSTKVLEQNITINNFTWQDELMGTQKVEYKFFKKVEEQLELIEELEILPVLTITTGTDVNLSQLYKLNSKVKKIYFKNLELKQNAKIYLEDFKGSVYIEKIASDNGAIQTFLKGLRAAPEASGRSVGGFQLDISSGQGVLNLNLIAESGGDGKPAPAPDANLAGRDGVDGNPSQFTAVPSPPCFGAGLCLPNLTYNCIKNPENGSQGERGLRGYSGTDAGHGGSIEKPVLLNKASDLRIQFSFEVGQKGLGGPGGLGGKGGHGGLAGDGAKKDLFRFLKLNPDDPDNDRKLGLDKLGTPCPAGTNGADGPEGETGISGHDGRDGIIF